MEAFTKDYFAELIVFIKENKPSSQQISNEKNRLAKKYGLQKGPTNIEVLLNASHEDVPFLKRFLQTKPVRTISGVAVIAIMAKPYGCPHGRCTMCPGGANSLFGNVPNSYTGNEPATMRAIRNNYDSYLQVFNRLEQYVVIGQNPDKVDLIIMGGTFPFMPVKYQEEFVYYAFKAMNDFSKLFFKKGVFDIVSFKKFFELPGPVGKKERVDSVQKKLLLLKEAGKVSLKDEQRKNESSMIRCIGLTIETKPDYAKLVHANQMLKLGCTRVELGVQSVYDHVLKRVNRGHTIADTVESIRVLKDLGFKLNFHMMLGLPEVDRKKDIESLKQIVLDSDFQPDMLKLYPCMVMPGTKLEEEWKLGLFNPISTDEAALRIVEFKKVIPKYVRIMRVQRDIPTKLSKAGVDKNNLRQLVEKRMNAAGIKCRCIRCREIKDNLVLSEPELSVIEYNASQGREFFISFVTKKDELLGFCRLRFPSQKLRKEIGSNSSLVRELHVYGTAVKIGSDGVVQHKGLGRKLMAKAEEISSKNDFGKVVVISGVGVRSYYRKLGYRKEGPYMVKKI